MDDRRAQRLEAARHLDQPAIAAALFVNFAALAADAAAHDLLRRRHDLDGSAQGRFAALIGGAAIEDDAPALGGLGLDRDDEGHDVARPRRALDLQGLADEHGSRAGKSPGEHRRDQSAAPAALGRDRLEAVGRHQTRFDGVGIERPRRAGEAVEILGAQRARECLALADRQFVEGVVLDAGHGRIRLAMAKVRAGIVERRAAAGEARDALAGS